MALHGSVCQGGLDGKEEERMKSYKPIIHGGGRSSPGLTVRTIWAKYSRPGGDRHKTRAVRSSEWLAFPITDKMANNSCIQSICCCLAQPQYTPND
ncbi:unnamed protein product [Protopolystoma xenopodis]|uniref:Uncharacterized protein n=1 Tax=Protopolystoma xenopodis TaxID=117903 RepID=A0A448WX13_9PLAT|nr:unnamed protein product [Protopolystoma xenopodis]